MRLTDAASITWFLLEFRPSMTVILIKNTKIGISIPKEILEDIDNLRKISNRSKFISELIRPQIQMLKGGSTS